MPRNVPGVNVNAHGDKALCMVVGCGRRALYRNGQSKKKNRDAGYCSTHKDLAVSDQKEPALRKWMQS